MIKFTILCISIILFSKKVVENKKIII